MSRISAARLCRLLGTWNEGKGVLAEQLASALIELVTSRNLPIGGIVPSERALADALAVGRGTISAAYSSLREIGVLDSRRGSGSRLVTPTELRHADGRITASTRLTGEDEFAQSYTDMSSGALEPSPLLIEVLKEFTPRQFGDIVHGHGYHPAGLLSLRWAISQYYRELGVDAHPDNILVTSGAQQAVWLLFNTFLDPGDPVVIEDPSYRGSLEALRRRGARILTVPMRADGLDMQALSDVLRKSRPKMLYFFPEAQNPTGATMPQEKREQLAELLRCYNVTVVEDSSQSELQVPLGSTPRPFHPLVDPGRIATVGTLSKLFWGGLRIGWVLASKAAIRRLISAKAASDLGSAVVDQHIAVHLLNRVDLARRYRQRELSGHLDVAEAEINAATRGWTWNLPVGGSAIWMRIPDVSAIKICQQAQRKQLILSAGPGYSANENFGDYIRFPFVRTRKVIREAVATIAELSATAGEAA